MTKNRVDLCEINGPGRQAGLSLVELMVAMVIGLFVVASVSILFVNSKKTYLAQDANSRMQESARYAYELLGRQVRLAGYSAIQFTQLAAGNLFAAPPSFAFGGTPLAGTEGGAQDTITLSFDATKDCLGQTVTRAVNLFRINASNQLECLGNGSGSPGVILEDVESIQILYGQPAGTGFAYLPANTATMSTVTTARICVLIRARADSDKRGTESSQIYTDCSGAAPTGTDGYLRRAFTMTIDLRNRLP